MHNTQDYGVSLDGQTISQSGARNISELKAGVEGQLNQNTEIWGNVGGRWAKTAITIPRLFLV